MEDERMITVCAACLCASCWQGAFMCDEAYNVGTVDLPISNLREMGREHPQYWEEKRTG